MTHHIGIVACSAEGASLCYRTLCAEGAGLLGPHAHPEVSLHSPSLADYVQCLDRGDLRGVADLMLRSAHKLAASGADLLICPDNTIHQALPLVLPQSPRPWLHIAEVVAAEARQRGHRRLGVLGTRWLVDSAVYADALAAHDLACVRPTETERDEVHQIIMDELVAGLSLPGSVARLQAVIQRMKRDGCDAVILGCTELPLVLDDTNSPLPTLDSTRLQARAALQWAVRAKAGVTVNRSMPPGDVIPELAYPDVPQAAAWLCRCFGFTERLRIADHRVQLQVGSGAVVVVAGPSVREASGVMVRVADVDHHFAQAQQAGAPVFGAPQTQPYGERQYSARDLAGHQWTFSQSVADVHPRQWGGTLLADP